MQSQGIEFDNGLCERNNEKIHRRSSDSLERALKVALARKLTSGVDL